MDHGAVRNLEQIQEVDAGGRTGRLFALLLVGLGGAAVVFAALALNGRKTAGTTAADPLGELVAQKGKSAPARPELSPQDVTFPGILSDKESPTTALAAIRSMPPTALAPAAPARRAGDPVNIATADSTPGAPSTVSGPVPTPGDRLPVVPLPAKAVLDPSPVVTKPRDALTKAAADSAAATSAGPMVPSGREGGYQLQISSFRNQAEANGFAEQLRARGHKAHVSEANVAGRGTWYRVRVGPFPSQQAAQSYRSTFETKEHVVPFVVTPNGK
jgi:cell division septation protein DedD